MRLMTIGFLSQDWSHAAPMSFPNGCTWYRCVVPALAMNKLGHECHVGSVSIKENKVGVLLRPPMYDKDVIGHGHEMLVFKLPMHISNIAAAEIALSQGTKIVVDIDDWFDNLPDSNRAKQITDPELNKENNRDIYFQVIEMAHALICSTPFLYEFYKNKYPTKPIFMVRNSIDIGRWPKRKFVRRRPVIGWVGATPWRGNDLEQLAPFFQHYLKSRNVKFHHSGTSPGARNAFELLEIEKSYVSTSSMIPITHVQRLFTNIDIGIVPLSNIQFNHAKSYLKGLEYAAAGIPFVSSSTPEYEFLASHGVGRIAKTNDDWMCHFDELMNFEMRQDEAEHNLDIVKKTFSIDSHAALWEETYKNIMDIQ